jgi:hypothetical protein
MIHEHARQLIKVAQQKSKDMEAKWRDAEYQFRQEWGKAQRTVQVLIYRATTTCDNFYERISDGFQCVRKIVATSDEDALKKRCVIVNDWNTGVMRKRSKIKVQAQGNPIQSYEAKFPGKSAAYKRHLLEDNFGPSLDGFDEQWPPDQDLVDIELRDSGSGKEKNDDGDIHEKVNISEDWYEQKVAKRYGERKEEDDDDIYENVSRSKYWYAQKKARKTCPVQIENEVIVRKKAKGSSFFGGDGRKETLDRLIGVFKRNLGDYHLTE